MHPTEITDTKLILASLSIAVTIGACVSRANDDPCKGLHDIDYVNCMEINRAYKEIEKNEREIAKIHDSIADRRNQAAYRAGLVGGGSRVIKPSRVVGRTASGNKVGRTKLYNRKQTMKKNGNRNVNTKNLRGSSSGAKEFDKLKGTMLYKKLYE